jgi:hypothetical protein
LLCSKDERIVSFVAKIHNYFLLFGHFVRRGSNATKERIKPKTDKEKRFFRSSSILSFIFAPVERIKMKRQGPVARWMK